LLKEIIISIAAYGRAHAIIRNHKLWKWMVIPGLLYMLLYIGGLYIFFVSFRSVVSEKIIVGLGISQWLERYDSGLMSFLFSFTGLVVWLVGAMFYFSLFKYIWLILGSPIFSWLSEKTESLVTGKSYNFSLNQWLLDMGRAVKIAMRNLLWQSVYLLALLLISLIPLVGWAVPFLALIVEAYYFGFSMLDYSFERKRADMGSSIQYISQHKGLAIGNGVVFYLMHLIPLVGWVFAPAYAVIAATLTVVEEEGLTG
jgi:CysZ protein